MQQYSPKYILSLGNKKNRANAGLFVVEGAKSILELADSDFEIKKIFCTHAMYKENETRLSKLKPVIQKVEEGEIKKMSALEFNVTGVAIVKQKENVPLKIEKDDVILALDDIRDPGNVGTMLRTAEWYGITKVICSPTTADLYNNKVIAASMGSFTRVHVYHGDLGTFFKRSKLPVIGAMLTGKDAHTFKFPSSGILVMGNEANGIEKSLIPLLTEKITIPRYNKHTESLNVAIGAGILLDNWKR